MDPAAVALLAALIGAGSSIAATALTMWWTGRHESERQTREEAAALRAEKRAAYRDLMVALDAWREACVEIADGDRKKRDWDDYWQCRGDTTKAGGTLQLVGTDDMIDAAGEAMEAFLDVSWKFQTHTALAFGDHPPGPAEISHSVWGHIGAADREEAKLLDLMRVDLGFSPLTRERPTPPKASTKPEPPAGGLELRGS
jgi:hypothetical protein